MRCRRLGNIWHAKYLELSVSCHNPAVLTEKHISSDLQPMKEQDTGHREARGRLFFLRLTLAIYKQRAYIFGIRIYRSDRLHEDEGAMVFPVNNILL